MDMSIPDVVEAIDCLARLQAAHPGQVMVLKRRAIKELGGHVKAHEKMAGCLRFNHAWMYDPFTDNIIIGRLPEGNWKETMELIEKAARLDHDAITFNSDPTLLKKPREINWLKLNALASGGWACGLGGS